MEPQRSGPFPFSPISRRPPLRWPHEARVAVWVIPNLEVFALSEPMPVPLRIVPNVPAWAMRDYGNRVGFWRFIEVFARHGVRGTAALNSDLCDAHPEIIEEALKQGWEFIGHNESNTRRLDEIPPEDEPRVIHDSLARIERATGTRPVGWLGAGLHETWRTLEYLADEGCQYVADWVNDDQPYQMNPGGKRIVSLPYTYEVNDKPAFEQLHRTAEEFEQMIKRQFDTLYREGASSGRVMAIALHPYITGVPHRIAALDKGFEYILSHDQVWLATGSEIVDHFLASAR